MKLKNKEKDIHLQVVEYLKMQYPKALFRTDFGSGMRMTIGQAVQHQKLQSSRAYPDIFIIEPRIENDNGIKFGLFLELKKDDVKLFKKNGDRVKNEHFDEQWDMLDQLNKRGYIARFAIGFDEARRIIDRYLGFKVYLIQGMANEL